MHTQTRTSPANQSQSVSQLPYPLNRHECTYILCVISISIVWVLFLFIILLVCAFIRCDFDTHTHVRLSMKSNIIEYHSHAHTHAHSTGSWKRMYVCCIEFGGNQHTHADRRLHVCASVHVLLSKWNNEHKWAERVHTHTRNGCIASERDREKRNEKHSHEAVAAGAVAGAVSNACTRCCLKSCCCCCRCCFQNITTWLKRKGNTHSQSHERSSIIETSTDNSTGNTLKISPVRNPKIITRLYAQLLFCLFWILFCDFFSLSLFRFVYTSIDWDARRFFFLDRKHTA